MGWPNDAAAIPGEGRERIRLAILEQILALVEPLKQRGAVSAAETRRIAKIDGSKATIMVRTWKEGKSPDLRVPWTDPIPAAGPGPAVSSARAGLGQSEGAAGGDAELAEMARGALTHENRDAVLRELAARAIDGRIKPSDADKIRALLGEMRLQDKDRRTVPQEDPERIYLLGQDGARLVSAFEKIVSNERRAKALAAVADLLDEDARMLPAVDPVGRL